MGVAISGLGNGYTAPEPAFDHLTSAAVEQVRHTAEKAHREAEAPVTMNIDETAQDLERITLAFNKKLRFTVDTKLDQVIVKVIDPETDKVIRELPPAELQRLHLKIKEMMGLLFDEIV
jgi:flagellar protein FlaG